MDRQGNQRSQAYSEDGLPVFYKQTDDGPVKIWFGPTYNFRVPYLHTTHDFNRACRVQDGEERLGFGPSHIRVRSAS